MNNAGLSCREIVDLYENTVQDNLIKHLQSRQGIITTCSTLSLFQQYDLER